MSSTWTPSRAEVLAWNPQQLSDYLSTLKLSGCDKAVLRNSISGSRFVNLSEKDLQKFPRLHIPMISKISSEINKREKRSVFEKKPMLKFQQSETPVAEGWGDDEFDNEEFDEDDYESPCSCGEDDSAGDYESPNEDDEEDFSFEYEPPPTEAMEEPKLYPSVTLGDGDYIDKRAPPPAVCPRPPPTSRSEAVAQDSSLSRGRKPAGNFPPEPPQVLRHIKPGRAVGLNPSPVRGPQGNTVDKPSAQTWRYDMRKEETHEEAIKHKTFPLHNKSLPPRPGVSSPGESATPGGHSVRSLPPKLVTEKNNLRRGQTDTQSTHSLPHAAHTEDLDPRWYVGTVTRGQAEHCLRNLNKDGAYLVRDSSRLLNNQPFTLMVFYHNKVYNIQIRHEQQHFLLGTGLKGHEGFRSVGEMVRHFSQSPLLLIDAKRRSSGQQNQCMLSEPAAGHMSAHA